MKEIKNVVICGLGAIGTIYAAKISETKDVNLKILADKERINKYTQNPTLFNGLALPRKEPSKPRDISEKRNLAHAADQVGFLQSADVEDAPLIVDLKRRLQLGPAGARGSVAVESKQIGVFHRNPDDRRFAVDFRQKFHPESEFRVIGFAQPALFYGCDDGFAGFVRGQRQRLALTRNRNGDL